MNERFLTTRRQKPKGLLGRLGLKGAKEAIEQRRVSPDPEIEQANRQVDFLLGGIRWESLDDLAVGTEIRRLDLPPYGIALEQWRDQNRIIFRNIVDARIARIGWGPEDEQKPTGFQIVTNILDELEIVKKVADEG